MPDPAALGTRAGFLSRLKLKGSVGEGGDNRAEDRQLVRLGLGLSGNLPLGAALDVGIDDAHLAQGIARLHRRHGLSDRAQLVPDGRGEAILASNLKKTYGAQLSALTERGDTARLRVAGTDSISGDPMKTQLAQEGGDDQHRSSNTQPSQTGRYGDTADAALGIWEGGKSFESWSDYIKRAEQATGVEIPEYKKGETTGREPGLFLNWRSWHLALEEAGVGDAQHFAFMLTFAWEGVLTPHTNKSQEVLAEAGIPNHRIDRYSAYTSIPPGTKTEELSNKQRVEWYLAQFNHESGAFHAVGGAKALEKIGDKYVAAAIADTLFTLGTNTIRDVMQTSINATFTAFPAIAEIFSAERDGGDGSREARVAAGNRFGSESLLALQTIAVSPEAKRFLLNAIADARIAFDGPNILKGDRARYNSYRFQ